MDISFAVSLLGGFLTAAGAAILFHVPVRSAVVCGGIGIAASLLKILTGLVSDSAVLATFVATLLVALLSHLAARIEKKPVTVFLIPCTFPFVPGAGMYRIVYALIEGSSSDAITYFFQTMEIAGAIALSIFTIDTIFRMRGKVHTKCT